MAYCSNCGYKLNGKEKFCPSCGIKIAKKNGKISDNKEEEKEVEKMFYIGNANVNVEQ